VLPTNRPYQLSLPLPLSYPAKHPVPFHVNVLTALPLNKELLLSNLSILLLKVTIITCNGHRFRHDRIIGVGEVQQVSFKEDESIWSIQGSIAGGREGGETSWSLEHVVEVKAWVFSCSN